MKKFLIVATTALLVAACVSNPPAQSPAAPAPAPQPSAQAPATPPAPAPKAPSAPAVAAKKPPLVITIRIPLETKASVWFADGSLDETVVSERDSAGILLSQSRMTASGTLVEKTEFSYKENKLQSKTVKDGDGKLQAKRSYTYTPAGLTATETAEDGAGKKLSIFEYAYDASGKRVKWTVKDGTGTMLAETAYANKDAKTLSAELKDGVGRKTGGSNYEYGPDGKLIKQTFFDQAGSTLRVEATAWKDGRIVQEERRTPGGVVQMRTTYEYGPDGELLKKNVEDMVGKSKLSTTYEYAFREEKKTIEQ